MTQEEKDLLLKDLCGRLSYGVKVKFGNDVIPSPLTPHLLDNYWYTVDIYLKPYLRPMSSMTEEEKKEIYTKFGYNIDSYEQLGISVVDWLNSHHFDYRGLIEKGLALAATEGMYEK